MGSSPEYNAHRYRMYLKPRADRARRQGLCIVCQAPCALNPHTQRPFARCTVHRALAAANNKRSWGHTRARWRDAGLCRDCGAPVHVDPVTKRPLARCFKHQVRSAQYQTTHRSKRHD